MLNSFPRPIYAATEPVDMRKSFDGLAAIVKNHFQSNPFDGTFFVFLNRAADRIKILYWDTDGFALWYKRLEQGRFRLPVSLLGNGVKVVLLTAAQLAMIFEGIEPVAIKRQKRYSIENSAQNCS